MSANDNEDLIQRAANEIAIAYRSGPAVVAGVTATWHSANDTAFMAKVCAELRKREGRP